MGVVVYNLFGVNFVYEGNMFSGEGVFVIGNYFQVLGLMLVVG